MKLVVYFVNFYYWVNGLRYFTVCFCTISFFISFSSLLSSPAVNVFLLFYTSFCKVQSSLLRKYFIYIWWHLGFSWKGLLSAILMMFTLTLSRVGGVCLACYLLRKWEADWTYILLDLTFGRFISIISYSLDSICILESSLLNSSKLDSSYLDTLNPFL